MFLKYSLISSAESRDQDRDLPVRHEQVRLYPKFHSILTLDDKVRCSVIIVGMEDLLWLLVGSSHLGCSMTNDRSKDVIG